jgi:hypothetical protein
MFKCIGLIAIFIVVFGTIGNFLVGLVSYRLRESNTFIFIVFLSFNDTLTLYFWNLNHFIAPFFNIDIQNYSLFVCKLGSFVQLSSQQISAWMLV